MKKTKDDEEKKADELAKAKKEGEQKAKAKAK